MRSSTCSARAARTRAPSAIRRSPRSARRRPPRSPRTAFASTSCPTTYVNEAVAEGLLARTRAGDRVLVFRAQEARDVLPDALRAAGRIVDVVAAYRTRYVDDPELRRESRPRRHRDVHQFEHGPRLRAATSPTPPSCSRTRRLRRSDRSPRRRRATYGIRVDVVAEDFTVEGLLTALESASAPERRRRGAPRRRGRGAHRARRVCASHALTRGGAFAAFVVGTITFAAGTLGSALILLAFFVSSIAAHARKANSASANWSTSAKAARATRWQVLANGGIATVCIWRGSSSITAACSRHGSSHFAARTRPRPPIRGAPRSARSSRNRRARSSPASRSPPGCRAGSAPPAPRPKSPARC